MSARAHTQYRHTHTHTTHTHTHTHTNTHTHTYTTDRHTHTHTRRCRAGARLVLWNGVDCSSLLMSRSRRIPRQSCRTIHRGDELDGHLGTKTCLCCTRPCQPRQPRTVGPPTSVGQQPGPIARFADVGRLSLWRHRDQGQLLPGPASGTYLKRNQSKRCENERTLSSEI